MDNEIIGERIKGLRLKRKMTREALFRRPFILPGLRRGI